MTLKRLLLNKPKPFIATWEVPLWYKKAVQKFGTLCFTVPFAILKPKLLYVFADL